MRATPRLLYHGHIRGRGGRQAGLPRMAAQVCTVPEPMARDTQPSSCPSAHSECDEQFPLPRTCSLLPVLHSVDMARRSELMAMKCLEMASLVAVSICTTVRCGHKRPCIRVQLVNDSDGQFVTSQVTGPLTPWAVGRKVWL